jgi:hypothetical protein
MVGNSRFHRWRHAQGLVNAGEIVVHVMRGHRRFVIFDFFNKLHPQIPVAYFDDNFNFEFHPAFPRIGKTQPHFNSLCFVENFSLTPGFRRVRKV